MADDNARIVFHITGGNNQILPTATHAEQHFHYSGGAVPADVSPRLVTDEPSVADVPDVASRLAIYINKVELRTRFLALLRACRSASEVGRTVVSMVQEVPGLTIDTAKTEPFITILLCLSCSVSRGLTVPNFRKAITEAWLCRKD